jgi:hypothetical protein
MKKLYLLLTSLCIAASALAGDDLIINGADRPIPMRIISGGTFNVTGSFTSGVPVVTVAGNDSSQTPSTGTNWTTFASHSGVKQVLIENISGTSINFRYGSGTAFPIPNNTVIVVATIANSNELQVQRTDTSNSQVTVYWHYEG